ncbi:MAG: AraC family transcriptional regulator [Gammaproteobacteria bacterium]|nr:AraC family transcriptional regulator [Gammaproteobacteria bacterium]
MTEPRTAIPRFFLYGEPPRDADERFVHVETIAARSRLYEWRIRPHAHRDLHQLLVIFTGAGEMQAETQSYAFQAPTLLIAPAGVVHGFAFAPETEGYVVTLAEPLLRDLARDEAAFKRLFLAPTCASLAADPAHTQELADALPKLRRELVWKAPASAAAAAARLTTVLVNAVRALHAPSEPTSAATNARAALVARFREKVESHLRMGLSIAQYAKALSVTPARLRAACLEVTGKPPARVLEDRLLLEAKRNLTYTNMTVSETAYYLGFGDPAYFSRFFSKHAGESPAAFRKRMAR